MKVIKDGKLILHGTRSKSGDGLWDIPITQGNTTINPAPKLQNTPNINNQTMNVIIRKDKAASELATYLHAACFSPVLHTFIKATKITIS